MNCAQSFVLYSAVPAALQYLMGPVPFEQFPAHSGDG